MYIAIGTLIVWILGLICIPVMKKLEPDNKWYPVYTITILVLFTIWTVIYVAMKNS